MTTAANGRAPGAEARAGRFDGPSLIGDLMAIQREEGWLPRARLEALARDARRPLYEIEGLISFYPHFRTEPARRVELAVCRDLTCWLRGGEERIAALRARYADDAEVALHEVSCIGRCDRAPAVAIDERPAPAEKAEALVEAARQGAEPDAPAAPEPRRYPNDPYAPGEERYRVLRRMLAGELTGEQVIAALDEAGLRGMGGAGFPTGRKWGLVASQRATPKYAICNADESEPGTFKDRQVMAEQPHLVIEGMLLGMLATGAQEGYVFIRHEYDVEEAVVRAELERVRAAGLLREGSSLEVFTSPGGYILGEESALIECIEGHRGEPRNKPPFPGVRGLWGQPTLMNSVETFADVPVIVERGASWWRAQGVNGASGLKFFAVSGHVERPGVYCVALGTPVGELIELAGGVSGGRALAAVQPGGASSNFIGPDRLDLPLDFDPVLEAGSMLGSGALVVVAQGTDLLAAATNVLRFFRDESCGKCVPCRVGSHKAHEILTGVLARGGGADEVPREVVELEETLRLTSICGLGQVALGPVLSVLALQGADGPAAAQAQDAADVNAES